MLLKHKVNFVIQFKTQLFVQSTDKIIKDIYQLWNGFEHET